MADYQRDPNNLNSTTDDDLPGMWSHSDFEGGDPDERSYFQRWVDEYDREHGTGAAEAFVRGHAIPVRFICGIDPAADEPIGYDSMGAPLYQHQIAPEGTE